MEHPYGNVETLKSRATNMVWAKLHGGGWGLNLQWVFFLHHRIQKHMKLLVQCAKDQFSIGTGPLFSIWSLWMTHLRRHVTETRKGTSSEERSHPLTISRKLKYDQIRPHTIIYTLHTLYTSTVLNKLRSDTIYIMSIPHTLHIQNIY